jgi:hypothetical protein
MEELVIKRKVEDMIAYGYICLRNFPKTERFTLAADIKACLFRVLHLVIVCAKRYYKKTTLSDLDIELEMLKSLVRLAKDLTFLPFKQYENWQTLNLEIGKMVGAWIKNQHTASS